MVLRCTILYCTMLHYTILYYTVLYSSQHRSKLPLPHLHSVLHVAFTRSPLRSVSETVLVSGPQCSCLVCCLLGRTDGALPLRLLQPAGRRTQLPWGRPGSWCRPSGFSHFGGHEPQDGAGDADQGTVCYCVWRSTSIIIRVNICLECLLFVCDCRRLIHTQSSMNESSLHWDTR